MNFIKYMTMLAAAAGTMTACQELEQVQMFAPEDVVPPVLHSLPSEIAITAENMATPVTFTWDAADFGVSTQVNYSIEAAYGSDTLALFTGISGISSEQTYESLNAPLSLDTEHGGLGLPAGTPTDVKFMISATAGTGQAKYYSEAVVSKVTVTVAERVYPMIYVIGDYCGWADDKMQKLFSFAGDEIIYSGVVDFGEKAANGFKIKGTATGWDVKCNWGLKEDNAEAEPATLQLWSDGGSKNIMNYSHRFYRFAFDRSSLVLSKQFSCDKIGIVGDAVGSWDNDLVMNFDAQKQKFWVDATLAEGEMKFRADGAWTLTWGVNAAIEDAVSGVLDGGNNIKVPAGNYRIYLNLNNPDEMTFELNAGDYGTGETPEPEPEPEPGKADWYIHGKTVATPDWGGTPMTKFDNNDFLAYKAENIEVTAGSEFLFKSADESQWLGVSTSFAGDANPYPCVIGLDFRISGDPKVNAVIKDAGYYDYWILPEAKLGYVAKTGEKPGVVPGTFGLVGTVNGWGAIGDFSMTEDGAYFVRKGVVLKDTDGFKIRKNNEWNDAANFGTESGGKMDINTAVSVVSSGGSQNMSVQLSGTYDIYLDFTNLKVYVMSEGKTPSDAQ